MKTFIYKALASLVFLWSSQALAGHGVGGGNMQDIINLNHDLRDEYIQVSELHGHLELTGVQLKNKIYPALQFLALQTRQDTTDKTPSFDFEIPDLAFHYFNAINKDLHSELYGTPIIAGSCPDDSDFCASYRQDGEVQPIIVDIEKLQRFQKVSVSAVLASLVHELVHLKLDSWDSHDQYPLAVLFRKIYLSEIYKKEITDYEDLAHLWNFNEVQTFGLIDLIKTVKPRGGVSFTRIFDGPAVNFCRANGFTYEWSTRSKKSWFSYHVLDSYGLDFQRRGRAITAMTYQYFEYDWSNFDVSRKFLQTNPETSVQAYHLYSQITCVK